VFVGKALYLLDERALLLIQTVHKSLSEAFKRVVVTG
jgi:hypothetical protein